VDFVVAGKAKVAITLVVGEDKDDVWASVTLAVGGRRVLSKGTKPYNREAGDDGP